MSIDQFAKIAEGKIGKRTDTLTSSPPMEIDVTPVFLCDDNTEPFPAKERMKTHAELKHALSEMRDRYAPFLRNLAPEIPVCTKTIDVKNFILNGNENITIPYYGGPLGFAVQEYETTFELTEDFSDKAVYICFGGVDYIATVYINGDAVGRHEGFFSPFEFEISRFVKKGENKLRITVENDYVYMGSTAGHGKPKIQGDKMYAATGLGYDDPIDGWHHCPPGMGIYSYVRVEVRNRINITDMYVRPLTDENAAEVWLEVENADYSSADVSFNISVFGQNFKQKVIENYEYKPVYAYRNSEDDFRVQMNACDAKVKKPGLSVSEYNNPLYAEHGKNIYKIRIPIENQRMWTLDEPYLYQVQAKALCDGKLCDAKKAQFGMRSFTQDTESTPKGMFYLNGNKIKLRGANTMGFEQQDVLRGDTEQLINDILLGKICNMNFWRLTQRPVQDEVYEYCDKLGLLTQTDLPLFGCMRRTKFAEMVRQTEEMVRLVRKHPCNVVVSYINEPIPGAYYKPHRHMERNELEDAFEACDKIVRLNCPECVIKHVDGDYDPPSKNCIQDNHCYTLWYNAHGIDFGKLHRGWWMDTDKSWYCGCGEYGAEALDPVDLMKRRYPKEWIAKPFNPKNILRSQASTFHNFFYETPESMEEWVSESHKHQAFATKVVTEAFRRRRDMITCAIHLFIDAWPSGWMKTIMDCERTPKPAYFECRDAFSPVLVSLRSDRFTYFEGERISVEAYICNDTNIVSDNCSIVYELYSANGKKIKSARGKARLADCDVTYAGNAEFTVDGVNDREKFVLKAILLDGNDNVLSTNEFSFEVFEDVELPVNENVVLVTINENGEQEIAGETVSTWNTYMFGRHFVSCKTGHRAVKDFRKDDFKYWYNKELDMITPLAEKTFIAEGFTPILTCGTVRVGAIGSGGNRVEGREMVVGEKVYNGKRYIVSTLDIRCENPIAKRFLKALLDADAHEMSSHPVCR